MADESKALIKVDSFKALQRASKIKEVIEANFGNRGISLFNLERVRIPAGGSITWNILDPTGEESVEQEIIAMIPYKTDQRCFWERPFEDSGGGSPPSCHSTDLILGFGNNGESDGRHECRTCPRNQWKQGVGDTVAGKECREMRVMFLLRKGREEHIFPSILVITPGSLKNLDGYLTSLTSQGLPFYACLHRLTLEKTQSKGGVKYAAVKAKIVRELDDAELKMVQEYGKAMAVPFGGLTITQEDAASK